MTNIPEEDINQRFARFLRERLKQVNNNESPSVSVNTARFNHLDNWRRPVSAETMRRWLRGVSLPELSRLPTLCRLLCCSPMDVVEALGVADLAGGTVVEHSPAQDDNAQRACDALRAQVVDIMQGMDGPRLRAIVALLERRRVPRSGAEGGPRPSEPS